jgi:hypothetical protein
LLLLSLAFGSEPGSCATRGRIPWRLKYNRFGIAIIWSVRTCRYVVEWRRWSFTRKRSVLRSELQGVRSCNHTFDVHLLFWPRQEKRSGSSLLPHTRRNARFRRSPAGIEGSAGLVEVDDQRGVIRWDRFSFPRLAIDFSSDEAVFFALSSCKNR